MRMRIRMRILSSSSKPISSPGRTEKFPPPLMRFLRSDVSSRSRGRAKASPLFFRRKKSINASSSIETTQEPSSPKVTCIGQVRVRRSKNSSSTKTKSKKTPKPNKCCDSISYLWDFKCFRLPKWNWKWSWRRNFLFSCRNGRVRTAASSSKNGGSSRYEEAMEQRQEHRQIGHVEMQQFDDDDDTFERGRRSSASEMGTMATTPLKNAFLLTRCRSSTLASRFWGEEDETEVQKMRQFDADDSYERGRTSSASEMGTAATEAARPPENAFLLTRCRSSSLSSRFWGEEDMMKAREVNGDEQFGDDDVYEWGRRSSVLEMGTTSTVAISPPLNAFSLTRSTSSSQGEPQKEGGVGGEGSRTVRIMRRFGVHNLIATASRLIGQSNVVEHGCNNSKKGEDSEFQRGRSSTTSEMGTAATTATKLKENGLLLTRCKSSSLACRFWDEGEESKSRNMLLENESMLLKKRDTTEESRGDRGSNFIEQSKKSMEVCAEEQCSDFTDLRSIAAKNEGVVINEKIKFEEGRRALKLRRCKSEPSRRDLENFDPQSSEFWRHRRLSNVDRSVLRCP